MEHFSCNAHFIPYEEGEAEYIIQNACDLSCQKMKRQNHTNIGKIEKSIDAEIKCRVTTRTESLLRLSEMICRAGADVLEQQAIQLRQRVMLIREQERMTNCVSSQSNESSPMLCTKQHVSEERLPSHCEDIKSKNKFDGQDGVFDLALLCKGPCSSGGSSSIPREARQDSTHRIMPEIPFSLPDSEACKRKICTKDTKDVLNNSLNKKARFLNLADRQHKLKSNEITSPCEKNKVQDEDIAAGIEEQREIIWIEANKMKKMENLLRRMEQMHQALLIETTCINHEWD